MFKWMMKKRVSTLDCDQLNRIYIQHCLNRNVEEHEFTVMWTPCVYFLILHQKGPGRGCGTSVGAEITVMWARMSNFSFMYEKGLGKGGGISMGAGIIVPFRSALSTASNLRFRLCFCSTWAMLFSPFDFRPSSRGSSRFSKLSLSRQEMQLSLLCLVRKCK